MWTAAAVMSILVEWWSGLVVVEQLVAAGFGERREMSRAGERDGAAWRFIWGRGWCGTVVGRKVKARQQRQPRQHSLLLVPRGLELELPFVYAPSPNS